MPLRPAQPRRPAALPALGALAGVLLGAVLWAGTAQAQSSMTLQGTVNPDCWVSIQPDAVTVNITGGSTNLRVARVREYCNDKDGFTLSFSSANSGAMVNGSGGRANYTMSYQNTTTHRSLATGFQLTRTSRVTGNNSNDLFVTMPANAQAQAGAYWDSITLTIRAR